MLHNRAVNTNLAEELADLGCTEGPTGLANIAARRLDEQAYEGDAYTSISPAQGAVVPMAAIGGRAVDEGEEDEFYEDEDPIDGVYVTHELFDRIEQLDVEGLDEEDVQDLLDGLSEKLVPEDDELMRRAADIATALVDLREEQKMDTEKKRRRVRGAEGAAKIISGHGFHKGKRVSKGELKKAARKRRKSNRRRRAKNKKYARTRGKRLAKKRARRNSDIEVNLDMGLAEELRGILSESEEAEGPFEDTLDRVDRVIELVCHTLDDDGVASVLYEAWDECTDQLTESADEEDLMEALKPVMSLIAHCLKEIDQISEDDDDDEGEDEDDFDFDFEDEDDFEGN